MIQPTLSSVQACTRGPSPYPLGTPPRARATASEAARSRAQPKGVRPNGRRERSAPVCAAPHGLQQTTKVLAASVYWRQQQKLVPVQKLRVEVGESRGSEAGDRHGDGGGAGAGVIRAPHLAAAAALGCSGSFPRVRKGCKKKWLALSSCEKLRARGGRGGR